MVAAAGLADEALGHRHVFAHRQIVPTSWAPFRNSSRTAPVPSDPDWAISFKEGSVKHIYFVAETKGTMSSMKLREIENTKIACARKFFDEIGQRVTEDRVKYDVVTSYEKLMDIVGRAAA